jgi:hypothetical protein
LVLSAVMVFLSRSFAWDKVVVIRSYSPRIELAGEPFKVSFFFCFFYISGRSGESHVDPSILGQHDYISVS